ncbi:hypothetical protein CLROS_042640 [Clostridium felsineum]|uniref:Uncharacterized protein n=1 Tax=Clostridium felsineum TaxID=36839 RepID=A0A1S8LQ20_9CLOT|nr:hypothetical protein CLROS_042640 [Clostridium felsineum]URZ09498.1 hypothetical protein CROST_001690 [Clostridium felsineum]
MVEANLEKIFEELELSVVDSLNYGNNCAC